MSCGVGPRCGLDLALLWLWCRPAAAALIQPLAWELPYAVGAALKSRRKEGRKERERERERERKKERKKKERKKEKKRKKLAREQLQSPDETS